MIIALSTAAAYLILLGIVLRTRTTRDPAEGWLLGYCVYSALLMGVHALLVEPGTVSTPVPAQLIAVVGFLISMGLVGALTLGYLASSRSTLIVWGVLAAIWAIGAAAAQFTGVPAILSAQTGWLANFSTQISLSLEILVFGWLLLTLALFGMVAQAFIREPLPLMANRILLWAVILPSLVLGDALAAWLVSPWNYVGYILRLVGTVAAVYGVITHRVLDLRNTARWWVSRIILTAVMGAVIFGGILAAARIGEVTSVVSEQWILMGVLSLLLAAFIQPVWSLVRWLLRRLIDRDKTDAAEAVRLYSQRIGGQIDIKALAAVATKTTNELLGIRRSALILATQDKDRIQLDVVAQDRSEAVHSIWLAADSPIYQHFLKTSRPLLQYDIDYHKDYRTIPPIEHNYFSHLEMDIYAPIVSEGKLLGMLALGPKQNDDPFQPSELELLTALANQTVAALENARLVNDLRILNREISTLNQDLKASNERLERLDSVKSDFISIASHELRTPLTQMQGYADLLIEMSERNLLSPDQIIEIMTSLRRASLRMGEVISSMLDVSQIDVENMDLNFVETSLASIVKLAIEPFSEAIHQRNLTLVARGLRNLPPVYADYKRLVQAFENLITNAIKFTPDGGKINVTGEIFEKDADGQPRSTRITIEDSGIGIDAEHQDLIFEKFYRIGSTALHSTGSTKFKGAGPGLGLPIAKGIIDGHGGRIWVESDGANEETYPGSAFHVVLPIRPPAMEVRERMNQIKEATAEEEPTAVSNSSLKMGVNSKS
jgi:signal transduction histidine kinase